METSANNYITAVSFFMLQLSCMLNFAGVKSSIKILHALKFRFCNLKLT